MMFEPDGRGPWAVRYHWIRHTRNQEFLDNYFAADGDGLKLNLRTLTGDRQDLWKPHNQNLANAEISGDMIWRVKILNPTTQSIDHMEVWRSREVLDRYFHADDNPVWPPHLREELHLMLVDRGFRTKNLPRPYPLISKVQALQLYAEYVRQVRKKQPIRIETRLRMVP